MNKNIFYAVMPRLATGGDVDWSRGDFDYTAAWRMAQEQANSYDESWQVAKIDLSGSEPMAVDSWTVYPFPLQDNDQGWAAIEDIFPTIDFFGDAAGVGDDDKALISAAYAETDQDEPVDGMTSQEIYRMVVQYMHNHPEFWGTLVIDYGLHCNDLDIIPERFADLEV